MDAVRLGEGRWELDDLVGRAEAGETVDIMRGERVVAKLMPAEPHAPEQTLPDSTEARETIWEELRRFRATLPYDPSNSVEEMRREARY